MVFFTCHGCGESVKKAQVEKHVNICKNSTCLSCIDCAKDFWGEDYKNHIKCISEDQKYGGKGFEVKSNKGDVKQQQWIQKVHEAINKPNVSPKVCGILKQIQSYDNVPRKKVKFQNWMKNSLKIHNTDLQDQVWEIFSAAVSSGSDNQQQRNQQHQTSGSQSINTENKEELVAEQETVTEGKGDQKKSKRERKEERRIKKNKKEKKELNFENQPGEPRKTKGKKCSVENGISEKDDTEERVEETVETNDSERKKKKKHKRQDTLEEESIEDVMEDKAEETVESNDLEKKKKKKHKKQEILEEEIVDTGYEVEREEEKTSSKKSKKRKNKNHEDEPQSKQKMIDHADGGAVKENEESEVKQKGKFNWKGTIKAVLQQAPDNELSIKKLKKKVLAQYCTVTGDANWKTEGDIVAIFNKKIKGNPKFRILKDKVKLVK